VRNVSFKKALMVIIYVAVLVSSLSGMSYFYIEVEGSPSTTHVQGQPQVVKADCAPLGRIDIIYYADLDSSGTVEDGEPIAFMINYADNNADFPADNDLTEGIIEFDWPLNMPQGHYVVRGVEDTDVLEFPYVVSVPDPLFGSISGRISLEAITPPDDRLANYPFLVGMMSPTVFMYAITDEWGDYSVNWPGPEGTVFALFMASIPGYETPDMPTFYVDGHVSGFDVEFRLGSRLENLTMLVDDVETSSQTQGQTYGFAMDCVEYSSINIEFFVDTDGDGLIGGEDWSFFGRGFDVNDNGWTDEWFRDQDDDLGSIYVTPNFHLPPGDYILVATDYTTYLEFPFSVSPPPIITTGVSGRITLETITPPDDILNELVFYITASDRRVTYYSFVDDMGDFSCTWADGEDFVSIGIKEPYPSPEWDFSSATFDFYLDSLVTDLSFFINYIAYEDSIHVIFEQDTGIWEIGRHEIVAYYIDPISHALIDMVLFPDSGEIYIPVRSYECGIIFGGSYPEFVDHNFISPYDTLWITPTSFPPSYYLFASQCCYHFKLKLDGFPVDFVPPGGIEYHLYGEGPAGQQYYSQATMFVQFDGTEYVVSGGRELCPATWTAIIPDTLPSDYIPEVSETSFVIPRVDSWPHMLIVIPVHLENIEESELPKGINLSMHPNPFNSVANIDFRVETSGAVSLEIYNIAGKRIATLFEDNLPEGTYRVRWDTKTNIGEDLPSGIYLFRLNTIAGSKITKGMYLK
jgi:hypothetical protein